MKDVLSPGAKGWISKYFYLVDNGTIVLKHKRPKELSKLRYMHYTLTNSGIVYGYPDQLIFATNLSDKDWTKDEKLKLLLFESLLFVYTQIHKREVFNKNDFLDTLYAFYQSHGASSIRKAFGFFLKESKEERLEKVLTERIDIKTNLFENRWWISSFSNVFTYLDVVLFDDFEHKHDEDALAANYTNYALACLTAITVSAHADGIINDREKNLFKVFLASANLKDDPRDAAKEQFKYGASYNDIPSFVKENWLLKRFLIDISILTIVSDKEVEGHEFSHIVNLCEYLEVLEEEMEESLSISEGFLLRTQGEVDVVKDTSSYEKVYSRLTARWRKILMRNRDKLGVELKQSKELIALVKKSTSEDLTQEEKETVKAQFIDIAKSVPALAIFMLPGGAILLPLILKIIPDLVPSAFKENEIDED